MLMEYVKFECEICDKNVKGGSVTALILGGWTNSD